jgi:hypothetical protein
LILQSLKLRNYLLASCSLPAYRVLDLLLYAQLLLQQLIDLQCLSQGIRHNR